MLLEKYSIQNPNNHSLSGIAHPFGSAYIIISSINIDKARRQISMANSLIIRFSSSALRWLYILANDMFRPSELFEIFPKDALCP